MVQCSQFIRRLTLEKSAPIFRLIREFTQEKNCTNVMNVEKPSATTQPSFNIRKFILERNLTNVMNVEKLLV